tara:strand:+ start:5317 stop:7122 length:1806 start_codon:yes stop_codon:yes gene_type:complete
MAENVSITIRAFDKTQKSFKTVTSGLAKVTGAVFSMRTALVGVAGIAGFGLLVRSSLNATDSLAKTAAKIGTTTESLGGLRYAAELTGVATNTMDMALQRFTRRTAEAAMGTGEAKAAIKELGLNAQELNRMPLDKRMVVLADAFFGVTNESDRLRLAFKLFDSEGAALVNTLSGGGDALKDMLGEAKALGLTMSGSAAKGVEDTVDAFTKLQSLFTGVRDQIVAALAPAIEGMVERFTAFLQRSIEAKGGVELFARSLAVDLLKGVQGALIAFQNLANGFVSVYNGALEAKDALTGMFTSDEEKNARQLANEIGDVEQAILDRTEALKNEANQKYTNYRLELNALEADKARLLFLQKLLTAAEESEEGFKTLAKFDFATTLNAQIAQLVADIGKVGSNIVDLPKAVIPPLNNIEQAFKDWGDTIPDLNESIKSLTTQGLDGLTDALTAGITGAANFADAIKNMAKSVVDSLIKMLVQKYIVDAAFGFITSKISSLSPSTKGATPPPEKAIGGPVFQGERTLVGERGPEIFVPNANGSIIPNHKLGGGSGVTINQTVNITTGIQSTVRAEVMNLLPAISKASQNGVADARLRGGQYARALG